MNCKPLPYFLLLHIFFVAASLSAADIKVDTVADEYCEETDETCSLREAIEAANTNAAVCGCPAGEAEPVFDNIPLPAGIYELSRGSGAADTNAYNDLDIASSLNILGPDTGYAVVSGRGLMRVFEIHSGTVMFSQLAIQYGLASPENGGGILVRGGIFTGRRITLT
ncbi:MAG: CSLREA domain-containing protein, partial [Deltaproteobacteria bacterium]|nr:CSLREA domain-containing protein [Deltaproteobacteria bacterium]